MNVLSHALQEQLAGWRLASFALEDPGRSLLVPDERMPDNVHAPLRGPSDQCIGSDEIKAAWAALNRVPFEGVPRRDDVEVVGDEIVGFVGDRVSGKTDAEGWLKKLCQRRNVRHGYPFDGLFVVGKAKLGHDGQRTAMDRRVTPGRCDHLELLERLELLLQGLGSPRDGDEAWRNDKAYHKE